MDGWVDGYVGDVVVAAMERHRFEREREGGQREREENVSKRRQPITQLVTMNETIEPIKIRKKVGHWTSLLVDSKKDLASTRFRCKR